MIVSQPHCRALVVASMVLYGLALLVPAVHMAGSSGYYSFPAADQPGWMCLTLGVLSEPFWLANPFLFIGWFLVLRKGDKGLGWALASLVLAFAYTALIMFEGVGNRPLIGNWMWLASIVLTVAAAVIGRIASR